MSWSTPAGQGCTNTPNPYPTSVHLNRHTASKQAGKQTRSVGWSSPTVEHSCDALSMDCFMFFFYRSCKQTKKKPLLPRVRQHTARIPGNPKELSRNHWTEKNNQTTYPSPLIIFSLHYLFIYHAATLDCRAGWRRPLYHFFIWTDIVVVDFFLFCLICAMSIIASLFN